MTPNLLEQLNLTNDETIHLWYRRNASLTQPSEHSVVQVQKIAYSFFSMDNSWVTSMNIHMEKAPLQSMFH